MIKKAVLFIGLCFCLSVQVFALPQSEENITSAKAAIVMEMKTGRVLWEYNAKERMAQASTTKIMTTMLTLEQPELDTYFTVDSDAIHVEGSSMGLQEGDQVSLRQLCYGMILPSGNDAANAAAVRIAGSIPQFSELMNERAAQLGLKDTAFVTPSGLDAPGHYTTAYDLAELTRNAMENPDFREICGLYTAKTHFGNPPYDRWLKNHNKLLDFYEPCIGVKTGFTDNAGRVLVSAAAQNGIELICVTMNDANDWADHQNLYERFFEELVPYSLDNLAGEIRIPVVGGNGAVLAQATGDLTIPLLKGEEGKIEIEVHTPDFLYAPAEEGDYVGHVEFMLEGDTLYSLPLTLSTSSQVPDLPKEQTLFTRITDWLEEIKEKMNQR